MSTIENEILLVSNDQELSLLVKETAEAEGLSVRRKKNIQTAVRASKDSQIVVVDCILPDGDCVECLQNLNTINNDQIYIVIVDGNAREKGIQALRDNAFFYLIKPVKDEELRIILERALEFQKLRREVREFYQCNMEDFLRGKLEVYMPQINRIGGIALYDTVISEVERALIKLALETTGGNRLKASALLGINRNTLRAKLNKYKI
ncbi:MAG: response regulator [Nitrospirae bacterium]|nr:MAG: response regulator [Nitrospirota bacterium]